MSILHSKTKEDHAKNMANLIKHGKSKEDASHVANEIKKHVTWDDKDEHRIENSANQNFVGY